MSTFNIECPHCKKSFELTDALAAPIVAAERAKALAAAAQSVESERAAIEAQALAKAEERFAEQLRASSKALAERDAQVEAAKDAELAAREARAAAEQAQRDIALTVRKQVDAEKGEIERRAAELAQQESAAKLKAATDALAAKDEKLKAAEQAELEAHRLKAAAEDAMRQVELTVARQLDQERSKVREAAVKERDEENRLKVAEKDKQLADLREQIEELRRKGHSGSQQLAGEVLELDLLEILQTAFQRDSFERVGKGQRGGDVLHTVRSASGVPCGTILWESKRTQRWSDGWLGKLRDDQRSAKCDLAALMTETLPEGISHFDQLDGVWVTGFETVVPLAGALRQALIEIATARRAAAGADSKKDLVYGYLTGQPFRARVCGLIEPLIEMRSDLEREKRLLTKQWSAREKQLERCTLSLTGLYGDLHGIVGATLPQIDGLTLPALEDEGERPRLALVGSDVAAGDSNQDR